MTLDAEGYINISPPVRLQSPFQEVVDEVTNHLTLRLGHLLHSVYLYGSVAQGKAVAGVSDLDVCILLTRRANNIETHTLSDIRKKIALNHPIVCKIDFDVGILSEALNPDNLYSWGYWLKHHCRCIYGEDLSKRFDRFKPSKAIAIAVNGDFIAVLEEYIRRLAEAGDDHQRKQL
ncbi:nucleotidyltransferase domain-containing protein [Brenneria goodwinii]|nr:nucleotidyltransferase domain-containing protein [Brenneria goodwinii]